MSEGKVIFPLELTATLVTYSLLRNHCCPKADQVRSVPECCVLGAFVPCSRPSENRQIFLIGAALCKQVPSPEHLYASDLQCKLEGSLSERRNNIAGSHPVQ